MIKEENYFENMITDEERARLPYLETIPMLVEKCSHDYGEKTAMSDDGKTLTYNQLPEQIGRRINLLDSKNISPDAHVAVMCRNNVDAMCWLLAIPSSGRVLMMLPCMLSAGALEAIVEKYDIDAMIAEECFLPLAKNLSIPVMDASECGDQVSPLGQRIMSAKLTHNSRGSAERIPIEKDTTAAIYLTGGTTGSSKGVVLSHGALMRGAKNGTYRPNGTVFNNRVILMLPLSHIFGSIHSFLSCLYTGTEIYGCNDVKSGLMQIPIVRPTTLIVVPGMAEIALNLARIKGAEFLGDVKTIICGGAPVPPRLIREAKKYNINLYPGYGMTEGTNLTTANVDIDIKPHSMGKVYPKQEVKTVNGELWIRGDNVMKGYYKDPEATAKVLTEDGWFKTGDLVTFDDEGFMTVLGRINNLIILPNGENISPEEIEDTFNQSDLIQDCLVKEGTSNGHAVLEIEILPLPHIIQGRSWEDITALIHEEVKRINDTLPSFKQVNKITVREKDFKRTGALKIDRANS